MLQCPALLAAILFVIGLPFYLVVKIHDLITFILNIGTPNDISNLTERIRNASIALAPVISPMSIMFSIFQPNSVNSVFVLVFALSSLPEINIEWSPLFSCFGLTARAIPNVLRVFTTLALGKL